MDERLRVLQLIRDQKVSPEMGLELLQTLDCDAGYDLSSEDAPARQMRITTRSLKSGKEKNMSFNVPLGFLRFVDGLFPDGSLISIRSKQLDRRELMDIIHQGKKGEVLREQSEKGEVIIELL